MYGKQLHGKCHAITYHSSVSSWRRRTVRAYDLKLTLASLQTRHTRCLRRRRTKDTTPSSGQNNMGVPSGDQICMLMEVSTPEVCARKLGTPEVCQQPNSFTKGSFQALEIPQMVPVDSPSPGIWNPTSHTEKTKQHPKP